MTTYPMCPDCERPNQFGELCEDCYEAQEYDRQYELALKRDEQQADDAWLECYANMPDFEGAVEHDHSMDY